MPHPPRRPPRAAPLLLPLLLGAAGALAAGCTEYDVAHSKLTDEVESEELTLAQDTSTVVNLRLEADSDALDVHPSSWLDITVFAVRSDGLPVVSMTAGPESDELAVSTPDFLEVVVDGPFSACSDEETPEFDASWSGDVCGVTVPVTLGARAGDASVQVAAHAELNFGSKNPPGTLVMTLSLP